MALAPGLETKMDMLWYFRDSSITIFLYVMWTEICEKSRKKPRPKQRGPAKLVLPERGADGLPMEFCLLSETGGECDE